MALFLGPPEWASARIELLDFMVQGKTNRGRHTDHPAGRHSIRTNQCPPPPSPFFTGRMPFLPPNQQCQSTEGNWCIWVREKTLEFSWTVQEKKLRKKDKWGSKSCKQANNIIYSTEINKQIKGALCTRARTGLLYLTMSHPFSP